MSSVVTILGFVILAIFIWKSKLSKGWKKFIIGFLTVAIIGNILILVTGHTLGYLIRQALIR